MLIIAVWILGLCLMTGPTSDPTMASHQGISSSPATLMVMEPMMAMSDHECCDPVAATPCEGDTALNLQQWLELLTLFIYIVIALFSCWLFGQQFARPIKRCFVSHPPPIYLFICVFRH
jgi:hypothetical protein